MCCSDGSIDIAATDVRKACEALGANAAINYREEDFVAVMKELGGADVILDMVGGSYIGRNMKCLKVEGRLCIIAFLESPKVESFNFLDVLIKRLTITGSTLRPRTVEQKASIAKASATATPCSPLSA